MVSSMERLPCTLFLRTQHPAVILMCVHVWLVWMCVLVCIYGACVCMYLAHQLFTDMPLYLAVETHTLQNLIG